MDVSIEIERSDTIPAAYARVRTLLNDVPRAIRLFPKLRQLTEVGKDAYLWEMSPIGSRVAKIAHEVSFATKFVIEPDKGRVRWKPLPGRGNAEIEGCWQLQPHGNDTHMTLRVWGDLHDVPVPLIFRPLASPYIQGKFAAMLEHYFDRLEASLDLPRRSLPA
jgi:hypothetical protein